MADIQLAEQSAPTTPTTGNGLIFIDSTASILCFKDDSGRVGGQSNNAAVANQLPGVADAYITNSDLIIPSFSLQAKTRIQWRLSASKTAAGIATPIYTIRTGTLRTTGDTSRLALTGPAQTAIADIGTLNVVLTVRTGGAATVIQGTAWWDHRGTAATSTVGTGFANDASGHVEATSASFDSSALGTGPNYIGLSINPGASAAWTITQVWAEANW